ncbi:hypothetical protein MMC07_005494 [Pseudocyphellaria aurata]|nr:hypothetical protein [Pseudocyphellaria aurata]
MSPSTSLLARYRPAILVVTAVAAGCTIYYIRSAIQTSYSSQPPPSQHTLHRSNAQRRNRQPREPSHPESNTTTGRAPPGDAVAADGDVSNPSRPLVALDQLHQALLDGDVTATDEVDETEREVPEDVVGPDANSHYFTALRQVLEESRNTVDAESEHSWRDSSDSDDARAASKEGQSLLNLLYRIAEEQARKDGYVHRGISCNCCGTLPIRGIRYRCVNCSDVDLCETCEAMQVHPKTHVFYKVRIPAPLFSNPKQPQPVWYPGKPTLIADPLPPDRVTKHCSETGFQNAEVEALWEQFRCLAATEWIEDPDLYRLAIDRPTFDKCFIPNTSVRPPPPNLIYDRLFAFYDTNRDGLIGFDEFLRGLSCLNQAKSDQHRRKIYDGYDINDDGFVDRKDFLRMFRAFYALSKEMAKEVLSSMDEDFYEGGAREIVTSSQPISAAFAGNIPPGERSRTGEGKIRNESGDYVMKDDGGIVRESGEDTGDHNDAVGDAFEASVAYGSLEDAINYRLFEESMLNEETHREVWPPTYANDQDVLVALNIPLDLDEVNDPADQEKVRRVADQRLENIGKRRDSIRDHAIKHRWHRQQFYLDEENGALPPIGFKPSGAAENQPPSRRSRSSSKVRFQDDLAADDDHETRSATSMSSRSIPIGERWGGYEVPGPEKDTGREILYQVAQEGLNELLDPVFRQREDLAILASRTKREREHFQDQLWRFVTDELRARIKKELDEYEWRWRNLSYTFPTGHDFFFVYILDRIKFDDSEPQASAAGRESSLDEPPVPVSAPPSPEGDGEPMRTPPPVMAPAARHSDEVPVHGPARILPYDPRNRLQDASFPSFLDGDSFTDSVFESSRESFEEPYIQKHETHPDSYFDHPSRPATPDPTLPQNRPGAVEAASEPASGMSTDPPHLDASSVYVEDTTRERLLFLAVLDLIEVEGNQRGGPGRISFEEFEEFLAGPKGSALGFVGQWVEMARF